MATFGDLYQDALDTELGSNDSAVLFTTARRKHAINEGYRHFCDLTECLVRQSTISSTNGSQEYNLLSTTVLPHGDFLRIAAQGPIFRVHDSQGLAMTLAGEAFPQRAVPWLDAVEPGWRSTAAGLPESWYLRADGGAYYLGLDRPLALSTGSTQTAEVVVPYVIRPSSMTASTETPFTISGGTRGDLAPYTPALVHYAAHELEKLRKDPEASDRQLQKFLGYVQRWVQACRPKGPRSVRMGRSYFQTSRRGGDQDRASPWWR